MIYRLQVCDLNAIETRVGAWLAGCDSLLNVFTPCPAPDGSWCPNGKDPYLDFGGKLHGIPYDGLWMRYNSKDDVVKAAAKAIRQMAKPGVLGAIYRMAGGGWVVVKGDRIRTGLWGYAWGMGIELTQEQAHMVVRMFREAYPEICSTAADNFGAPIGVWKRLELATQEVIRATQTKRTIG